MTTEKGKIERKKMVACMEYICRQINDEEVFMPWLMVGVADGDIDYGDLDPSHVDEWYIQDDIFRDLMGSFLWRMSKAKQSGGLYCDNIVSPEWEVK